MEVSYNKRRNEYTVKVTKAELEKAFRNPIDYQFFLHDICAKTHGEYIAEILFPIKGLERSNE